MSRRRTVVGTAAVCLVLTAAPAQAAFTSKPTAATVLTSDTLQPPSGVTASSCTIGGSSGSVTVSWTASTSSYATGYTVTFTGGSATSASSPVTVTVPKNATYTFTVVTTYRSWKSATRTSSAVAC